MTWDSCCGLLHILTLRIWASCVHLTLALKQHSSAFLTSSSSSVREWFACSRHLEYCPAVCSCVYSSNTFATYLSVKYNAPTVCVSLYDLCFLCYFTMKAWIAANLSTITWKHTVSPMPDSHLYKYGFQCLLHSFINCQPPLNTLLHDLISNHPWTLCSYGIYKYFLNSYPSSSTSNALLLLV